VISRKLAEIKFGIKSYRKIREFVARTASNFDQKSSNPWKA